MLSASQGRLHSLPLVHSQALCGIELSGPGTQLGIVAFWASVDEPGLLHSESRCPLLDRRGGPCPTGAPHFVLPIVPRNSEAGPCLTLICVCRTLSGQD
jgi:hypothetical protein